MLPVNYEELYHNELQKNINEFKTNIIDGTLSLEDKDTLNKKIRKYCNRHGLDEKYIAKLMDELKTSEVVRSFFVKDPQKQNFYENVAMEHIQNISGIDDIAKPPNVVIFNGIVQSVNNVAQSGGVVDMKTIDFGWTFSGKTFYAAHKYTKEPGGGQDNQYMDLAHFIDAANLSMEVDTYFLGIADGQYYQAPNKNGRTKMTELKNRITSKYVHICTIDEVEYLVKQIVAVNTI